MKNIYLIIIIGFMAFSVADAQVAGPAESAAVVAVQEPKTTLEATPVVVSAPKMSAEEAVLAIRLAKTPEEAMAAYSQGMKAEPESTQINQAYLERMVELEVPHTANYAAQQLVSVDPANGLAWGVLAYMEAERGNMPLALTNVVLAAKQRPDHPFILRTAGQLFAWYDSAPSQPPLPETIRTSLAELKGEMAKSAVYFESYRQASEFYKNAAENAAEEELAEDQAQASPAGSEAVSVQAPSALQPTSQNAGYPAYGTAEDTSSSNTYNEYYYNTNYYYDTPGYSTVTYYYEPYYVRYWPTYYRSYYSTYFACGWPCYPSYYSGLYIYLGYSGRDCARRIYPRHHYGDHHYGDHHYRGGYRDHDRGHDRGFYARDAHSGGRDGRPGMRKDSTYSLGMKRDSKGVMQVQQRDGSSSPRKIYENRPNSLRSGKNNTGLTRRTSQPSENRRIDTPRTINRGTQVRNERPTYNRQRQVSQPVRSSPRTIAGLSNRPDYQAKPSLRSSSRGGSSRSFAAPSRSSRSFAAPSRSRSLSSSRGMSAARSSRPTSSGISHGSRGGSGRSGGRSR